MALFRRNRDNQNIPPELAAYYDRGGWRLWFRRILGVVILLAVLAAIAWAALWVYNAIAGDKEPAKPGTESAQTDNKTEEQAKTEDTKSTDNTDTTKSSDKPDETATNDQPSTSGGSATTPTPSTTGTSGTQAPANGESELIKTGDDTLPATGG